MKPSVRDSLGMDWNVRTPSQWDFESLALFNANASEMPKLGQPAEWGTENGSVYSSGGGVCSGSELANGCSSKSSISASIDSAPRPGPRASMISFGAGTKDPNTKELGWVEDIRNSPDLTGSVCSAEPLIGLKLGKRTYFEDVCTANNMKDLSFQAAPVSSSTTTKKSRVSHQSKQYSHCQVEGCNVDLTTAKSYHRKHRVCESHSKCSMVIVAGQERRFCQQCSRFHDLSEFDQKKRSCRRRLSDHNARRRKPPPDTISCNSARLSSSFYDDGQQMNLLLNASPFGHTKPAVSTWGSSYDFSLVQAKESCLRSTRAGGNCGQLCFPSNEVSMAAPTLHHDLDRHLLFKEPTAEVLNQGPEATFIASNLGGALDLRRALSLLSRDSWSSAHHGSSSISRLVHVNNASSAQTGMQVVHHPNSGYGQAEQPMVQETRVRPFPLHSDGSHFQEFQLLKAPCGTAFFDSNQMD